MIITYDPDNGLALPDNKWDNWYKNLVHESVIIGNEYPVWLIRLGVKRGELDHSTTKFKYKNEIIDIDSDGNLKTCSQGFLDHIINIAMKLF